MPKARTVLKSIHIRIPGTKYFFQAGKYDKIATNEEEMEELMDDLRS